MIFFKKKYDRNSDVQSSESFLQFLIKNKIIKRLVPIKTYPDEPFQYMVRPDSNIHIPAHGSDFFSEEKAKLKSLGETYERFVWMHDTGYKKELLRGNETQLSDVKETLSLSEISGFSEEQRSEHTCLKYGKESIFSWLPTNKINENTKCYVPAQLLSSHYWKSYVSRPNLYNDEPMLRWGISTGVSAGRSKNESVVKSTLEVIERAVWMENFSKKSSPGIYSLSSIRKLNSELESIISTCEEHSLKPYVLKLVHNYSPLQVVAVLCLDTRRKTQVYFTMGTCAHFSFESAVIKAFEEALALRHTCRYRLEIGYKSNDMGLLERALHYAKKENFSKIDFLIKGPMCNTISIFNNSKHVVKQKDQLINIANINNFSVYEYTFTPKIKKSNLFVTSVVIPELLPMHSNESIPYYPLYSSENIPINPFS